MRLYEIPKKLFLVPVVSTLVLAVLLANRFAIEYTLLFLISFFLFLAICVGIFFIVFKPVNLDTHGCLVYQRDGRLVNTGLRGGLALVRRFSDRPLVVDVRIQSVSTDGAQAFTRDPVEITMGYFLQWQVIDPVSYTALPTSWKSDLNTIVSSTIQNQTSPLDVRTLLATRGVLATSIESSLRHNPVLLTWGIRVIHFEITSLDVSKLVKDLLTREFVARFITPALVKEGQNTADTFAAIQAIAGGDAALLQILKTVNETFGKK
ncbi:MAG: SPFH domain-containing protein [Chloroflexota bacterium]|nr:SPFH domain-containing protein [Chloroflexota bacterium]